MDGFFNLDVAEPRLAAVEPVFPEGKLSALNAYADRRTVTAPQTELLKAMFRAADVSLTLGDYAIESRKPDTVSIVIEKGADTVLMALALPITDETGVPARADLDIELFPIVCSDLFPRTLTTLLRDLRAEYLSLNGQHRAAIGLFSEGGIEKLPLPRVEVAMREGIYSPTVLSALSNVMLTNTAAIPERVLMKLLAKTWRSMGTSLQSKAIFEAAEQRKASLRHDVLMLIAAFYCECGSFAKAIDLANFAKRNEPAAWKWNRYLGLINLLYSEGLVNERFAEIDAENFAYLTGQSGTFLSMLAASPNSFAVVGNSPVLRGTGHGERIDQADVVVRFNSAERHYPLFLDCGRKLDILVMNPDYAQTRRPHDRDIGLIVFSNGDLYSSRNLSLKLHDLKAQYRVELLPPAVDRAVLQQIHASPSSGLKTLYWIYSHLGPIPEEQVFGFSLNDQAFGTATSYASDRPKNLPIIHEWNAERVFLDHMLGRHVAAQARAA